ncbi:MAG: Fic family protein [Rhodothermia bacterium]|nr:MAG: Fic family protein [Rhodothermia bacterium]
MYIWEIPDWPHFSWDQDVIAVPLNRVLFEQGKLLGRMEGIGFSLQNEAHLEVLTQDIIKSSKIEGVELQNETVRSSIAKRLGIDIGGLKPVDRYVEGVVEMTLDATQHFDTPMTIGRLLAWQAALFQAGRSGLTQVETGTWRTDEKGPMQVVSGAMGKERVHFEAPPAHCLDAELNCFVEWFECEESLNKVIKAGVAHLWFVTIHPFDDGNGRVARAIMDMVLARSERSHMRFYSLSNQIEVEKEQYYRILEFTQKGSLDITAYLVWYLGCLLRAIENSRDTLSDVLSWARFWDSFAEEVINSRQVLMIKRLLNGFEGKLTTTKWAKMAKCSQDTAYRDIMDLIERGILIKNPAGGRSTSYSLSEF